MSFFVQKFGGTSVGNPERIRSVAARIARARREGHRLVVVVSAMGHTTDELVDLAHQVSAHPPHREMDMLLSAGERVSMALMSMALADLKVDAVSFTGSQVGIITDSSHRRARILRVLGDRVRQALADGKVAIVAGFQGVSESKEITTLGRGGSDTTAVALAAAMGADECQIFTDVDGVFSADPRWVADARLWSAVSFDAMLELARRGAGVLHPRCVALAKKHGTRVRVLNSLVEGAGGSPRGTVLGAATGTGGAETVENFKVVGVTAGEGKFLLEVVLERPAAISAVWDRVATDHLSVTASAVLKRDGRSVLQLFADRDAAAEWKAHLQRLSREGFVRAFELIEAEAPVSVVSEAVGDDASLLGQVLECVGELGIDSRYATASSMAVTVSVPRDQVKETVRALHRRFFGQ